MWSSWEEGGGGGEPKDDEICPEGEGGKGYKILISRKRHLWMAHHEYKI